MLAGRRTHVGEVTLVGVEENCAGLSDTLVAMSGGTGCTGLRFWEHTGLGMETWLSGACEALGHMSPGMVHSKEEVPARGLAHQGFKAPEQELRRRATERMEM